MLPDTASVFTKLIHGLRSTSVCCMFCTVPSTVLCFALASIQQLQATLCISFSRLSFRFDLLCCYKGLGAHSSSNICQVTTSKQEAGEGEAMQKHADIKKLLSLSPRTRR